MQLSWRPAVDHLPGSRVAVVAVSAGLAPRRAGPRGREGAICPAPGCSCRSPRGTAREPARCPAAPGHGHAGPSLAGAQWPEWTPALDFPQGIYSLSHATAQTGCVSGASLCLLVFSVYTACMERDWGIPCPSGSCGDTQEPVTATPPHRAAPGLSPNPVPRDLCHGEGDDCRLNFYFSYVCQ